MKSHRTRFTWIAALYSASACAFNAGSEELLSCSASSKCAPGSSRIQPKRLAILRNRICCDLPGAPSSPAMIMCISAESGAAIIMLSRLWSIDLPRNLISGEQNFAFCGASFLQL